MGRSTRQVRNAWCVQSSTISCVLSALTVTDIPVVGGSLVIVIAVQLETVYLLKGLGPPKEHPEDQDHLSFQEQVCKLQLRVVLEICVCVFVLCLV